MDTNPASPVAPNRARGIESVQHRHLAIHEDEMESSLGYEFDRFLTVSRQFNSATDFLQHSLGDHLVDLGGPLPPAHGVRHLAPLAPSTFQVRDGRSCLSDATCASASAAIVNQKVLEHDRRVRVQRARHAAPAGTIVAGHKKDVVITAKLASLPGRVAIYGWHRPDGRPIQPLYTGHSDRWVDYSHGVRLVNRAVLVDGITRDMADVLRDSTLAALLSDDGVIAEPGYSLRRE